MVLCSYERCKKVMLHEQQMGGIEEGQTYVFFDLPDNLVLSGDIKLVFSGRKFSNGSFTPLFSFWFNCGFIDHTPVVWDVSCFDNLAAHLKAVNCRIYLVIVLCTHLNPLSAALRSSSPPHCPAKNSLLNVRHFRKTFMFRPFLLANLVSPAPSPERRYVKCVPKRVTLCVMRE
jgi:hypothetical protein